MRKQAPVAILHNYPIHYKHLLFTELERQGLCFEVLFTAGASTDRIETQWLQSVPYRHRVGFTGPYERASRWRTARFLWRSLDDIQPALVIISGYYDVAAWTAWTWAALHHRPRILWAESTLLDHPRRFYKELPKRFFVAQCDFAHVYGTASKAYIESLGMPDHRIITKMAVADVQRFLHAAPPAGNGPPYKVLLYVGRFSPEKNLEFLFRAFARLSQRPSVPRLVLALVGYGPLEATLHALAADLGISDIVQFWGSSLQEQLPALYRKADLLVLPSLRETWGLVVLEAMLSGLPVLVSERCGCAPDLVTPETGWTFSPYDESTFVRLLDEISGMPRPVLQSMGRAAAARATPYSPENCASIIIRNLNTILDHCQAPAHEPVRSP